jgi:SAM-dependent methyltransferase
MHLSDTVHYRCIICGGCFRIVDGFRAAQNGAVLEGMLVCCSCGVQHPIVNAIPRFVPTENYAGSFGYQWNIHRKTQLDSYTGLPLSQQRLFSVSKWPDTLEGQRILEAGSGAGRFTEVLLQTGAELFSFDYSNAVEANLSNNGEQANLHLFQGDIFNIPFAEESFDKVICLGVLQHTPDPEKAFMGLVKFVKPEGELVIDVYRADVFAYFHWKYVLRPMTTWMDKGRLYMIVSAITPHLVPIAALLRRIAGRAGARLVPIVEYSHLKLPPEMNKDWAILDTFDMYSPAHDHPQRMATVSRWFTSADFTDVDVRRGPNGIVGRGRKPGSLDKPRQ